ncbi:MAG: biosynthetic-type acetolactate synthase large subunit [Christensenellales bacterium]|jgi:acetolactate synthase-1/2/3 large subunit
MRMSGAQIIVETLIEQGADVVFGYPGGTVINIYDELFKASDRIKHYLTCHEQGAAHAADGYARATGKTGVVIATSGPGATNLVTGIAAAYLDSTPIVAITGNVACSMIGTDSFQEVDITGITMPITKHNFMVKDAAELAETLREAFYIASSGRPGPVLVDIPKDVQMSHCEFEKAKPRPEQPRRQGNGFDAALELIAAAERPFIYAGGGVVISDASKELIEFADKIDAPIGASIMGLSAVPSDNKRFLGMTGMHGRYAASNAMSKSDLIIAVGSRFSDRATGNKVEFSRQRKILHIDIDPAEIGKNIPAYAAVIGDVKVVLKRLTDASEQRSRQQWNEEVAAIESDAKAMLPKSDRLEPRRVIEAVRDRMEEDGVVATDVGQHQMWTAQYYAFSKPRTFITSGGLGAMGFGMGAAIGACIGSGRRTVLFTGDGSFHMNLNELATAVSSKLPLVIMVMNNGVLGMVRQWQALFFDSRYASTTPGRCTDYVMLAQAFGATGMRISSIDEMDDVLDKAFATDGPVVVDVRIDKDEKVLPMIPPGGTIKDIILRG